MDISILTKFYHGKLARAVFAAVADQDQVWDWDWDWDWDFRERVALVTHIGMPTHKHSGSGE